MTSIESHNQMIRVARTAGIWYLFMAITGILGFLVFHSQIYIATDPGKTLSNLIEKESLARTRLLLEFGIIVSQALTAVWFFRLFRIINQWAAWAVGIWGSINSMIIMVSAFAMGSAVEIAANSMQSMEGKILMIELLNGIIKNSWGIGGLFFGLWLIPLGYIVTSSKRMPYGLGITLILGGVGYLLSTTLYYFGIESGINDYLVIPATIGEFWMIGYLLIFGIRPENE